MCVCVCALVALTLWSVYFAGAHIANLVPATSPMFKQAAMAMATVLVQALELGTARAYVTRHSLVPHVMSASLDTGACASSSVT